MSINATPTTEINYREILLQLIGSPTLCYHLGDVGDDIIEAMRQAQIDVGEWDDLSDLRSKLGGIGVTTPYGTSLAGDGEDEEGEG